MMESVKIPFEAFEDWLTLRNYAKATKKSYVSRLRQFLLWRQRLANTLGRKNYMLAGSNKAAPRAAMMYSFFASSKEHDVNPRDWLRDVLVRIGNHPVSRVEELLPGAWK